MGTSRKRGSKEQPQPAGETAPVNMDNLNPREQWGAYTVYIPEHRARNVRHWCAPRSSGETRSIAEQFLELEREGKVCQYELLYALAKEVYGIMGDLFMPSNWPGTVRWKSMDEERGSMVTAFATLDARDMRHHGAPYGDVYYRAEVVDHEVMEPHRVTAEEAERWNERERAEASPGFPPAFKTVDELEFVKSAEQPQRTRRERIGERWVSLFIMEVRSLLGDQPDAEHIAAFNTLHGHLKEFQVGTKQGAPVLERLSNEGNGNEVLNAFERIRVRLLKELDAIATSLPDETPSEVAVVGAERLPWTSSTNAFAHIFTTLSTRGYFPMPRKGGKMNEPNFTAFARVLLQAFDVKGEDGKSLTAEQLRVRLTDAAPRPLAETKKAKFQIPEKGELIVPNAEELEERAR